MKRFRISDNVKKILWVINVLCLVGLAITFLQLVSIYFMQSSSGHISSGDVETRLQEDVSEDLGYEDTTEEEVVQSEKTMGTEQTTESEQTMESEQTTEPEQTMELEQTMEMEQTMESEQVMELSVEEQIDALAKGVEQWSNNGDQTIWFTVSDINMDNQLELITDSIQGSGRFAYNQYYVVDANGSMKTLEQEERTGLYLSTYYPLEDGVITVPVYYDANNNRYYSIQGTGVRGMPTSFRYSLCGLWIENEMVKEAYLGSRQHDTEDVYGEWTITYEDAEGNVITEEAFNTLAKKKFSGLQEMHMIWKWQTVPLEELRSMSQGEVKNILKDCYDNFQMLQSTIK